MMGSFTGGLFSCMTGKISSYKSIKFFTLISRAACCGDSKLGGWFCWLLISARQRFLNWASWLSNCFISSLVVPLLFAFRLFKLLLLLLFKLLLFMLLKLGKPWDDARVWMLRLYTASLGTLIKKDKRVNQRFWTCTQSN